MNQLRIALAAAVVAAATLLGLALPAEAYPIQVLDISDNHTCCGDGDVTIQVTSVPSGVVCTTLTVSARGVGGSDDPLVRKNGSLAPSQTFTNVKTPFTVRIRVNPDNESWSARTSATCTYDENVVPQSFGTASDADVQPLVAGGVGRLSTALSAATVTATGVLDKTACPDEDDDGDGSNNDADDNDDSDDSDDDDNGGLPNTGGERLLWLLIGLLLVIGGAIVIVTSRRDDGVTT